MIVAVNLTVVSAVGRVTLPSFAITAVLLEAQAIVEPFVPVVGNVKSTNVSVTNVNSALSFATKSTFGSKDSALTTTVNSLVSVASPTLIVAVNLTVASSAPAAGRVTLPAAVITASLFVAQVIVDL